MRAIKGNGLCSPSPRADLAEEPYKGSLSVGVIARDRPDPGGAGRSPVASRGQRAHALQYEVEEGFLKAKASPLSEMHPIDRRTRHSPRLYRRPASGPWSLGGRRGVPGGVLHQVMDSVTDNRPFATSCRRSRAVDRGEAEPAREPRVRARDRQSLSRSQRQICARWRRTRSSPRVQSELASGEASTSARRCRPIQEELGVPTAPVSERRRRAAQPSFAPEARAAEERGPRVEREELGRMEGPGREAMEAQVLGPTLSGCAGAWKLPVDGGSTSTLLEGAGCGTTARGPAGQVRKWPRRSASSSTPGARKGGSRPGEAKVKVGDESEARSVGKGRPPSPKARALAEA